MSLTKFVETTFKKSMPTELNKRDKKNARHTLIEKSILLF